MSDAEPSVWITRDVAIPEAVLAAHANDNLVFFVGAGASVGAPSGLPLFRALAQTLATMARVTFEDPLGIDYFLGTMPADFEVHRHARDLIDRENSRPNSTHSAIVKIANSAGQLRIVTTNFDTHLSSAAVDANLGDIETWVGPALPLGNEFAGIVHLHGCVSGRAAQLVLTDEDFGRAYLTDAWATRFLIPMFQNYTVVFIGYSHDDPIMRYLALGLPSKTPRFAFAGTTDADIEKWRRLGVKKISYPVIDADHGELSAALEAWDLRVRMGLTEHVNRMSAIVNAGTNLTPVDRDYIVDRLRVHDGVNDFIEAVATVEPDARVEWLRWLEGSPDFASLFRGGAESTSAKTLGSWFCAAYIACPTLNGAALQTIQRLGQSLSNQFHQDASLAAIQLGKVDFAAGRRWKVLLASSLRGQFAPPIVGGLLPYSPDEKGEHVSVLREALRPHIALGRGLRQFGDDDSTAVPSADIRWNFQAQLLRKHLLKGVDVRSPNDATLGTILEESLVSAYDLLNAYEGQTGYDRLSSGRSAIEAHAQDRSHAPINAIIDGLRFYGEKALPARVGLVEHWWSLNHELFRRLSLHLVCFDLDRTADEKLEFALARVDLYEFGLKHELYRVLAASVCDASVALRSRLLEVVLLGPNLAEGVPDRERNEAYAVYNLLVWLERQDPTWAELSRALAQVQEENPTFAPRDHPEFSRWISSGSLGGQLPMEPEDFIQDFLENPATTLADIIDRDYSESNFDQPVWSDALSLISQVVEAQPHLGLDLWSRLSAQGVVADKECDLLNAVTEGWGKNHLGSSGFPAVSLVATRAENMSAVPSITRFLIGQIQLEIESEASEALATMRNLARRIWELHAHDYARPGFEDPLSFAPEYLNSWPGELARYWLHEIDRNWRQNRDARTGMTGEECTALHDLITGPEGTLDATQPAIARQLYFLFAADASFTTENILPLFLADETSRRAWIPFLQAPRYDDKLLASGLLAATVREWDRLDDLNDDLRESLYSFVISIITFAAITQSERQELLDKSILGGYAVEFSREVVRFLGSEGVIGSEVWNMWLRDHLTLRFNGLPRTMDIEELMSWADSVPYLGSAVQDALTLFNSQRIGFSADFLGPEFPPGLLDAHGDQLILHYTRRVQNSDSSNTFLAHHIRELLEALRDGLSGSAIQPLVIAAERAFPGAHF